MREFSWLATLLGVLIGALLAAASAFVGLKVGLVVSASIPAAVMSLLVLRRLLKRGTILESNMVQTIASAGESVAAGMIFTIPALFIMGENPVYLEMVILGAIGGLLGVCFMVPLRQVLIVKEHGVLPYPEGIACAEVLQSGERGGASAKSVIWGAIVGAAYYFITGLGFWKESGKISLNRFRTEFQLDSSPALLGVGYILGARIAGYMLAGAVLSWFILIPAIGYFGASAVQAIFPATSDAIANMSPRNIYDNYIRYIGAGAVAIGGLISLIKSMPTITASSWQVVRGVLKRGDGPRLRTERDIPYSLLLLIIAGLTVAMWRFDQVGVGHIGAIAVVVFTFFFVTVSSRLVGLVGTSSNPVSGMTIATLLAMSLIYRYFVMDNNAAPGEIDTTSLQVTCLSVGAIVCIAITIGGDTSQDLKTGFLLKATPWKQQAGEMIGVLTSVVAVAGLLLLLNNTYGFSDDDPNRLPAYQANIMKILVEGVLGGQVPWTLIMMGGAAAVIVEMLGVPALPFAVGMYLPIGLSAPIMVGGLVRWLIHRKKKEKTEHDPGVLTASGLVAGMGLMGVAFAGVLAFIAWAWSSPTWANPLSGNVEPVSYAHFVPWVWQSIGFLPHKWGLSDGWWNALPMLPFIPLTIWLWWCARKRPPIVPPTPAAQPAAPLSPEPKAVAAPVTPLGDRSALDSLLAELDESSELSQPDPPSPATDSAVEGLPESSSDSATGWTPSVSRPKFRAGGPSDSSPASPPGDGGSSPESGTDPTSPDFDRPFSKDDESAKNG